MPDIARRSANEKLLYRLWEALSLAYLLRPSHGPHTVTRHESTSLVATRRRFQRNLALICDHTKGGKSTTALVIEDSHDCFRFWLSANDGVTKDTILFLSSILDTLTSSFDADKVEQIKTEKYISQDCIKFARERVGNARSRLRNFAQNCRKHLESGDTSLHGTPGNPRDVASWLQKFDFGRNTSSYDVCVLAYESRHDEEINILEQLGRDPGDGTNVGEAAKGFRAVKHFIGRLAAYVRVAKELLEDAGRLRESNIFEHLEVAAVPKVVPAAVPPADTQTCLEGILTRMLPARDPQLQDMLASLQPLNASANLETKIRGYFDGGIVPCVHAEIQMLEHCHRTGLKFAGGDRYIACSKPACLACRVYFDHHPGRFLKPDSHQKLYVNWAPQLQPDNKGRLVFEPDKSFFNKVIKDIREVALQQIEEARVSKEWHPDSLTMITQEEDRYDTSCFEGEDGDDSEESEDDDDGGGGPV